MQFISDSLYSPEITEAAASSTYPSVGQRHPPIIPQYPSMLPSTNEHASPLTPRNNNSPNDDELPSYTDLFIVPGNCKDRRRNI